MLREQVDILKAGIDAVIRFVAGLPLPILTFPLRTAAALSAATVCCAWFFYRGSRSVQLQIVLATVTALLAILAPIETAYQWLAHSKEATAFVFSGSVLAVVFLPRVLPRYLVPSFENQRRICLIIKGSAAILFIANVFYAFVFRN